MLNSNRYTVFDVMEAKKFFSTNPANPGSATKDGQPLYNGPQPFPKMLYHPDGEEKVVNPGRLEMTTLGPQICGTLKELIFVTVNDRKEEREFLEQGWHDHPAKAIRAGNEKGLYSKPVPLISSQEHVKSLEAKLLEMQEQLDEYHRDREAAEKTAAFDAESKGKKGASIPILSTLPPA